MQTKKLFKKRMGLSRVLTEIIFLLLATTTAVGAFTIYNGYSSNMGGTTKIAVEQVDIIASQNKTYLTVRNIGTTNIQAINVTIAGNEYHSEENLAPGVERTFTFETKNVIAGQQYTVVVKVLDPKNKSLLFTTVYTTIAKP